MMPNIRWIADEVSPARDARKVRFSIVAHQNFGTACHPSGREMRSGHQSG